MARLGGKTDAVLGGGRVPLRWGIGKDIGSWLALQPQPRRLQPLRTRLRWRQLHPSQAPAPAAPQSGCAARAAPHGRPPGHARWPRPLSWLALAHARPPSCQGWLLHQMGPHISVTSPKAIMNLPRRAAIVPYAAPRSPKCRPGSLGLMATHQPAGPTCSPGYITPDISQDSSMSMS